MVIQQKTAPFGSLLVLSLLQRMEVLIRTFSFQMELMKTDWNHVLISAAVGGIAPGWLSVGKTGWTSGSAIKQLSKQLAGSKTLTRAAKIQARISKHQNRIKDIVIDQSVWQAAKAGGKYIFGDE